MRVATCGFFTPAAVDDTHMLLPSTQTKMEIILQLCCTHRHTDNRHTHMLNDIRQYHINHNMFDQCISYDHQIITENQMKFTKKNHPIRYYVCTYHSFGIIITIVLSVDCRLHILTTNVDLHFQFSLVNALKKNIAVIFWKLEFRVFFFFVAAIEISCDRSQCICCTNESNRMAVGTVAYIRTLC